MSGVSTHGVGAAACAKADVASADSAAAIKRGLVENPVIIILPVARALRVLVGPPVIEQTTNAVLPSIRRGHSPQRVTLDFRLWDFPLPASRLCSGFSLEPFLKKNVTGDDSDELRHENLWGRCVVVRDNG